MFDPKVLADLATGHKLLFTQLADVEKQLIERFVELDDAIRALILAAASGEALLLIGPPGTAKSRLIRAFCGILGLVDEEHLDKEHAGYFEYLLTPFTEPGELFGFYDLVKAHAEKKLERITTGMMQQAQVVYLDEVFNGSSAILNSLLTFMNERVFHDRGERTKAELRCLFAATNRVPETPELRAIFDRFLLRCFVDNVQVRQMQGAAQRVGELVRKGWSETYGSHGSVQPRQDLLELADKFRDDVKLLTAQGGLVPDPTSGIYHDLVRIVHTARQGQLSDMSNRRLVKLVNVMLVDALYEATRAGRPPAIGSAQLQLIGRYFLDRRDEEIVQKLERSLVGQQAAIAGKAGA